MAARCAERHASAPILCPRCLVAHRGSLSELSSNRPRATLAARRRCERESRRGVVPRLSFTISARGLCRSQKRAHLLPSRRPRTHQPGLTMLAAFPECLTSAILCTQVTGLPGWSHIFSLGVHDPLLVRDVSPLLWGFLGAAPTRGLVGQHRMTAASLCATTTCSVCLARPPTVTKNRHAGRSG